MLKKHLVATLGCCLSFTGLAGTMADNAPVPMADFHPWSGIGSMGYTAYQDVGKGSGETMLGRFAIGKDLLNIGDTGISGGSFDASSIHLGVELGVQNGTRLSLSAPQATLDGLGGLPPLLTAKPMLDLLGTLSWGPMEDIPGLILFKGGVAYRQWQMDYATVNNVSKIAGEIQVGLGIAVAEAATLSLLYQGIYGSSPGFTVNAVNGTGHIENIPSQSGILLSLSLSL